MKNFVGTTLLTSSILAGLANRYSNSLGLWITGALLASFPPAGGFIVGGAIALTYTGVEAFMPDVTLNDNFLHSDAFKLLIFHELAHTNYAMQVDKLWWSELVYLEVAHNDEGGLLYGDGTFNDAGMVAMTEGWSETLSHIYVNRLYPINRSSDWQDRGERLNLTSTYIPDGLFFDLIDAANGTSGEATINGSIVNDIVSGYPIQTVFITFGAYPNGLRIFGNYKAAVLVNPMSNSATNLNALLGSYGR